MPEYLAPGLFVEEMPSGSMPLEGVGTNTGAFIGYAKSGDFHKPSFITSWSQFCQEFGEAENELTIGLAQELKKTGDEIRQSKKNAEKAGVRSWIEYAQYEIGKLSKSPEEARVKFREFCNKQFPTEDGPTETVNGAGAMPYIEGSYLAHAVKGYYDNGGSRAFIVRIPRHADIRARHLTNGAASRADGRRLEAKAAQITAGPLLLTARDAGASGNDIKIAVEHVGDDFRFKVSQPGKEAEEFPTAKDKGYTLKDMVAQINQHSRLLKADPVAKGAPTATLARPDAIEFKLADGTDVSNPPARTGEATLMATGTHGEYELRADDFVGDSAAGTGISAFEPVDGVNFVAMPDLMAGVRVRVPGGQVKIGDEVKTIMEEHWDVSVDKRLMIRGAQVALVGYCERPGGYQMAILDPLPDLKPLEMKTITNDAHYGCMKGNAAIYYPWIKINDPINKGQQMLVPPCGHIAGVWARVGVERGVHKAPANEVLRGVVALERQITKGEQEILNPDGINCIRAFPGQGIKIWGARTLATINNPSWKYVNVRRLFNYLEETIERSMNWVVFEPNDEDLWGRVRRNIAAFLYTEWREGKLFGATPGQAYYVRCDGETNPQETIDLGRLYCEIGVSPVKPAEFVIFQMSQWSGGSSLAEV